ncbi:D-amino acid aminotransferase [Thalassotalea sp. PLHSN55]|uniref:D-amino acid aminotransferase n=1 Tax=Thalassotalea sp. PLHSN55 TaxID=3435888 RepID=UPI003F8681C0
MTDIVYLNGDYLEKSSAKISVLDRGFLFGDGIYEVFPVYQSTPFRLQEHLERLTFCAKEIELDLPYTFSQWQEIINQVIGKNGGGNLSIYLQLTRGIQPQRQHDFPENTPATVLVMANPLTTTIAQLSPIKTTLLDDIRWQNCHIKSISLLGNILLHQQAIALGYQEAILHRDGVVTEGTTTNVFIVNDGQIYTPEKNHHILGGITRDVIIELAEQQALTICQQQLKVDDVYQADEVWLVSSSREISPVTQINDKIIANGEIGPIAKQMHKAFQTFKQTLMATSD